MKVVTLTVDADDSTLNSIGNSIESCTNSKIEELVNGGAVIVSVQVLPVTSSYSLSDPDSSYRDFHYTDRGFVIVIGYRQKENLL